jgi:predicted acetyltransferase
MNTFELLVGGATILQLGPRAERMTCGASLRDRDIMESPPVHLQLVPAEQAPVLENLFELYAHDLSAAFDLEVGEDGRFGAASLARYWREPTRCFPFLIRVGNTLGGFVLATRGSPATSDPVHLDVAELFVLRRHRRSGIGRRAAVALWDRMPGHWIVRVAERNQDARPFWTRTISDYTRRRFTEAPANIGGKSWTVFAFDSTSAASGQTDAPRG